MRKWLFLLMVLLLIGPGVLPRGFVSSAEACRSISLNLSAGRIQKPIPFHGNARALLVSSISTYKEKKSTSLSTASSLLDLLGGKQSALSVDPSLARKILSCLRFLVPPFQEAYYQSFHGFVQHTGESFFTEEVRIFSMAIVHLKQTSFLCVWRMGS
ncbi:hypothetical protein KP509_11G066700 [Ceratopteris richardii]|uniref:Uncharacterized protein n=1 Tax=Ceratopteris richardii TaxID=49495 RepID=A0A8T2TQP2_CERRI|nr:hypothetical protein KP509_11G066700 [Ceratopteris richardii]